MLEKNNYMDLVDGKFHGTSEEDLRILFQAIDESNNPDHLVIHFHGGLVDRKGAHATGKILMNSIKSGGGYPLFVIWNSDIPSVISKGYKKVFEDPVFHRLLRRLLQFVLSKYVQSEPGRGTEDLELVSLIEIPDDLKDIETHASSKLTSPLSKDITTNDERVIIDELKKDTELIKAERGAIMAAKFGDSRGGGPVSISIIDERIVDEIEREYNISKSASEEEARSFVSTAIVLARYGFKIFQSVIKRLKAGRDHGIYTTIVEELLRSLFVDSIGAVLWSAIKADTSDAFKSENSGGSHLIRNLKAWWTPNKKITLIGHSTGAIYIGHLLDAWIQEIPRAKVNVICLAPACTFKFLFDRKETIEQLVNRFVVFGLSDDIEAGYWEVPGYKGSLLYIVSGLLEPDEIDMPIVGMERYYQGEPYSDDIVREVKDNLIDETVWSITNDHAPGGKESGAKRHGDFEDQKTKRSLTYLIKNAM